jgi:hypothetical protein
MMNERVAMLRQRSLAAKPSVSIERAKLLTDFYRESRIVSLPMLRAQALKHLLDHKTLYIGDQELIVGERGPAPKATPTFPELCCHSEEDLEILNSRPKISYQVSDDARQITFREKNKKTFTKPVILLKVDGKTQP